MKIKIPKFNGTAITCLLLVSVGAFFRFNDFQKLVIFYGDLSRDFLTTYKIIHFHELVWHGPNVSVAWALLSPIYHYLWLPFYLLSNWHPLTQQVTAGLLSLVALTVLFIITKKMWGVKTAIAAGLIYASSAVVIRENIIGTNPSFVPIGTFLLIWSLVNVLEGKDKFFPLLMAALGWIISFHASTFFIIPPLIVVFLIYRPQIGKRYVFWAAIIFLFLDVIPYGIQEKKHGLYNLVTLYNFFFDRKASSLQTVGFLESILNFGAIVWGTPAVVLLPTIGKVGVLKHLVNTAFWLGLALSWKNFKKLSLPTKTVVALFPLYLLTFGLALKFGTTDRPNWWFGNVVFPLTAINAAILLSKIRNRVLLAVLLIVIISSNLISLREFAADQTFGRYAQEKEIAQQVLTNANSANFNLKYIYKGVDENGAQGPFAYLFWYFDQPRFSDKYFRWLNWQKPPADFPLYLVFQETSPSGKEAWLNKYVDRNIEIIKKTNFYEIYKAE
jgi:4-amino-4-deoxy-L-arabinose transferase-like glycosyltransferase